MRYLNLIMICILFLFSGCEKKEYPKDVIESSDAAFYTNITINGKPVQLEAGKNGNYMYSSFNQDASGLYSFIGEIRKANSNPNSPNSFSIRINDATYSAQNAASSINTALHPGSYQFNDTSYSTSYGIEFESLFNKTAKNYLWDFGDGSTSQTANPTHYFKTNGSFNVCLNINSENNCSSSICTMINNGSNELNAYINAVNNQNNTMTFACNILSGKVPYTYQWSFGDGYVSDSISPIHHYKIPGSYPVTLKLRDANGKSVSLSNNIVTGSDISSCASNIKIKSILPAIINAGFSEVNITYTDENGKTYNSAHKAQQATSNFNILSVEEFENNEKGEKTKKIKLSFSCDLFSGNESIRVSGNNCIICVAYK